MRIRVAVVVLLLCVFSVGTAQETKKRPVPGKEARAKVEALIQELFKDDLAKADKDAAARARLAQTLLFEGKETKDDPAGRYVLFQKAHDLAAQAGDVPTALSAVDELAHDFIIPPGTIFKMKIAMLKQASKAEGAPPAAYQSVIDRATAILDDTLENDDFPSSLELIAAAEQAARKLRSIPLVASLRKKQDEIVRQQKEFARWRPFADRLAKNPKDAAASLEMGMYYALIKGNWERGLPLLGRGAAGEAAELARREAAVASGNPKATLGVASDWLTLSAKLDGNMRTQALLRSYHWYQESLNAADDKTRTLIDGKLQEIAKLLPAEYRIGEITTELKKVDFFSGPVYCADFAPDARRFIMTDYSGALRVCNAKTGKELRQLDGHAGKVWTVAFAPDGQHAVSGGFDTTIRLWDVAIGREIKILEGHKDYVRSVAVSSDGKWILSGGDDRSVRLWNVETGKELRSFPGHEHTVWSVALSRDGSRALSGSLDKTVRLWDTHTGSQLMKLTGHKDTVLCVAFTPDGRHAVSGSTDKTLRLWDLITGQTIQEFVGSEGYVHSVAVSPDGRRILSCGQDHMLRLWDAGSGKEIRKLEGHRDQVWHVAFSRDGRLAISSGQDNSVRIWGGSGR